jgi:hypothetical protein
MPESPASTTSTVKPQLITARKKRLANHNAVVCERADLTGLILPERALRASGRSSVSPSDQHSPREQTQRDGSTSKMAIGAGMGAELIRVSRRELVARGELIDFDRASAGRARPVDRPQVIQERSSWRSATVVDWVPRGVEGEMARAEPWFSNQTRNEDRSDPGSRCWFSQL